MLLKYIGIWGLDDDNSAMGKLYVHLSTLLRWSFPYLSTFCQFITLFYVANIAVSAIVRLKVNLRRLIAFSCRAGSRRRHVSDDFILQIGLQNCSFLHALETDQGVVLRLESCHFPAEKWTRRKVHKFNQTPFAHLCSTKYIFNRSIPGFSVTQ